MTDLLCYDKITGQYFFSDLTVAHKIASKLNKTFRDLGNITLNQVYDIINESLPEDKKIVPKIYERFDDKYVYLHSVDNNKFEFGFDPVLTKDNSIILIFDCHPIEEKGPD